jgi:hypothetical protein
MTSSNREDTGVSKQEKKKRKEKIALGSFQEWRKKETVTKEHSSQEL